MACRSRPSWSALRFLRPTGDERLCARPRPPSRCWPSCWSRWKCAASSSPTTWPRPTRRSWSAPSMSLVWGAFALAALWIARTRRDPVALWAWRLSGGARRRAGRWSCRSLIANPVFDQADVGRLPIANGLLLAYALPAAMVALRAALDRCRARPARQPGRRGRRRRSWPSSMSRWRSAISSIPASSGAGFGAEGLELYAYSAVWLLFGVALLALGFCARRAGAAPRRHGAGLPRGRQGLPDRHGGPAGPAARVLVPRPRRGADRAGLRLSSLRIQVSAE